MKKNVKSTLKLAVLAGFVAGSAAKAQADDKMEKGNKEGDKAHAEKAGCKGPNGCNGECAGKDGSKMKPGKMKRMEKKTAPAAPATPATPGAAGTPATPATSATPAEPAKK